jgi:hypothetical protein
MSLRAADALSAAPTAKFFTAKSKKSKKQKKWKNSEQWKTGELRVGRKITMQDDFEIKDGVLVRYRGKAEKVIIPADLGITAIGDNAFFDCASLGSISLPEGLTGIGDNAFFQCTNLGSIILPASLITIGDSAFVRCRRLSSISLPESLTSIGYSAFAQCSHLNSITLPAGLTTIGRGTFTGCKSFAAIQVDNDNRVYADRDGVLFTKDFTGLIVYPAGKTASNYAVPDGVTAIGDKAFSGCSSLGSISLSRGLAAIGNGAFFECESLNSITLPASLTSIGKETFTGCRSLTAIQADRANNHYADREGVLFNKDFTELIVYPAGKTASSYTVPDGVTAIGDRAFSGCRSLGSISLPEGLTTIQDYAFSGCRSLNSISLPGNLANIGDKAFSSCHRLNSITVQALKPPVLGGIDDSLWYSLDSSRPLIHIPPAALDDYKNAAGWKDYADLIVPAKGRPPYW